MTWAPVPLGRAPNQWIAQPWYARVSVEVLDPRAVRLDPAPVVRRAEVREADVRSRHAVHAARVGADEHALDFDRRAVRGLDAGEECLVAGDARLLAVDELIALTRIEHELEHL